jgi:hypothetical protein
MRYRDRRSLCQQRELLAIPSNKNGSYEIGNGKTLHSFWRALVFFI